MKALHVALVFVDPYSAGGVQSQIAGRIDHLGAPGSPVRFTLFSAKEPREPGRWPHVRQVVRPGMERFSVALYEFTAARGAARALDEIHRTDPFDVVEVHGGGAGPSIGAWCRRRNVPLVFVAHSLRFFAHPNDGQRWEVHRYYRWSNRRACRFARVVVAVSRAVRAELVAFGVDPEKIVVMHTAAEPVEARDERTPTRGPNAPLRLLFVGRASPDKGLDVLLDAVERTAIRRGRGSIEVTVIGVDADHPLAHRAMTREIPVDFRGMVPPAETRAAIAETDLLVIPSRYDPCPVVAAEGLAAGALVLGTDAGGIPEVIENGRTGIIVPRGDPAALGRAIANVLDGRDSFRPLADSARRAFASSSWTARAPEILRLYRFVAASSSAREKAGA